MTDRISGSLLGSSTAEEVWQDVMLTGTTTRGTQTEEETSDDFRITQIHASQQEIKRRIGAFCEHKRRQVDISNVLELCEHRNKESTCARVDAVRVNLSRKQRVEKVLNTDGPNPSQFTSADRLQQELLHTTAPYHVPSSAVSSKGASYEQRLRNLECVLGTENTLECPLARVKRLEERLLQLEAQSPEYHFGAPPHPPPSGIQHRQPSPRKEPPPIVSGHPAHTHGARMQLEGN